MFSDSVRGAIEAKVAEVLPHGALGEGRLAFGVARTEIRTDRPDPVPGVAIGVRGDVSPGVVGGVAVPADHDLSLVGEAGHAAGRLLHAGHVEHERTSTAMIAITTSSSIRLNPEWPRWFQSRDACRSSRVRWRGDSLGPLWRLSGNEYTAVSPGINPDPDLGSIPDRNPRFQRGQSAVAPVASNALRARRWQRGSDREAVFEPAFVGCHPFGAGTDRPSSGIAVSRPRVRTPHEHSSGVLEQEVVGMTERREEDSLRQAGFVPFHRPGTGFVRGRSWSRWDVGVSLRQSRGRLGRCRHLPRRDRATSRRPTRLHHRMRTRERLDACRGTAALVEATVVRIHRWPSTSCGQSSFRDSARG